jgi:hypothetical protein
MSATLVHASPAPEAPNRIVTLAGLFWAFSYVLLTIRGALFNDDWTNLFDNNRLLAVSVGAGAYILILRQLQSGERITLRRALGWIVAATVAVMIVRFTIDELFFDVPQGPTINLLWSLTWSAYFALWVMGSLAFASVAAPSRAASVAVAVARPAPADPDQLEALLTAIVAEAGELKSADRRRIAAKMIAIGGYESIDGSPADNERSRLALRIAARLTA